MDTSDFTGDSTVCSLPSLIHALGSLVMLRRCNVMQVLAAPITFDHTIYLCVRVFVFEKSKWVPL